MVEGTTFEVVPVGLITGGTLFNLVMIVTHNGYSVRRHVVSGLTKTEVLALGMHCVNALNTESEPGPG